MNQKISTGLGFAVIMIVAAIFAFGVWKSNKRLIQLHSTQIAQQRFLQISNEDKVQEISQSAGSHYMYNEGPIYKNEQLGFQITLPKGWEKYKVIEEGILDIKRHDLTFLLPVVNDDDLACEKKLSSQEKEKLNCGYDEAFVLTAYTQKEWSELAKSCQANNLPCLGVNDIVGISDKYIISNVFMGVISGEVADFGIKTGFSIDKLKKTFRQIQ